MRHSTLCSAARVVLLALAVTYLANTAAMIAAARQQSAAGPDPTRRQALLGDTHFDIITVSYRFPATNGVEIIRLIREIGHRKDTPVLIVTGGHDATCEALAAGANEVLYKPIEPHRLVAAVTRHSSSLIAP